MRVLITGGTGFVGRPLCAHLLAQGHEVVVWSRTPQHALNLLPKGVATVAEPEDALDFEAPEWAVERGRER